MSLVYRLPMMGILNSDRSRDTMVSGIRKRHPGLSSASGLTSSEQDGSDSSDRAVSAAMQILDWSLIMVEFLWFILKVGLNRAITVIVYSGCHQQVAHDDCGKDKANIRLLQISGKKYLFFVSIFYANDFPTCQNAAAIAVTTSPA